jgi:hypothetical protein
MPGEAAIGMRVSLGDIFFRAVTGHRTESQWMDPLVSRYGRGFRWLSANYFVFSQGNKFRKVVLGTCVSRNPRRWIRTHYF